MIVSQYIVSFAVVELRCDMDNLVLLCHSCHRFVHSKNNTAREYLDAGKGVQ
jgi:hypothetical protein